LAADALSEHADWLESIPNAELLKQTLQGRNYTQDKLDLLEYDEEGLSILRQMNRGEQINARLLASEAYDLIFSRIDAFVERCEKGAVAR